MLPCDCALEQERKRALAALKQAGQGKGGRRARGGRGRDGRIGTASGSGRGTSVGVGCCNVWEGDGGAIEADGVKKDSGSAGGGFGAGGTNPGGKNTTAGGGIGSGGWGSAVATGGTGETGSDGGAGKASGVVAVRGTSGNAWSGLDSGGAASGSSGRSGTFWGGWGGWFSRTDTEANDATGNKTGVVQNLRGFCAKVYDYCGPALLWNAALALLLLSMYGKRYWASRRGHTHGDSGGKPMTIKSCCTGCPCHNRPRILKHRLKWPPSDYECKKFTN